MMAYQDSMTPAEVFSSELTTTRNFLSRIGTFFSTVGTAMVNSSSGQARLDRVNALGAKSDAELAEMGIKRDEIVHYVFRDVFYI